MKKKLLLSLIILMIPFMVFAGDISATATGSNIAEAEQNAYIELSKFINISVFDEQTLEAYSDDNSASQSSYSSQAIQTTANNFIKTDKKFDVDGEIVICTVTLLESTAPNYISLMSDYVKTINSLESSYDGKSELSFVIKKTTINNILEEYRNYDNAKSILLALDKFNGDIVKPNKTSAIWNNEYQNIIIQHNNELLKQMSVLDSTSTNEVIQNQMDSINAEIAQSRYELNLAITLKKNSTNQLIEQRQKEIDSTIDDIMSGIIKDNAISAESLSQSIDIKELLGNFNNYYNQYQSVESQYSLMLQNQKDLNERETEDGVDAIEDREYQFSDLNPQGYPGSVARAIRASEINTFKSLKNEELENNLKIINNKFTPMLTELQASMLSILSTIDSKGEFLLTLNPTELDCEFDSDDGCFYCTIAGEDSYLPIDGVKLKIPLASLDKKMDFNINDRHFDVNDQSQLKAYNDYTETVELYKNLMRKNQFLSYQFKLRIKASTVMNRFSKGSKYNAKIVTEIDDIQILRNDISNNVIEGARAVHGVDSRITKQYENFFNDDIPFIESYYSPRALDFYYTQLGKKNYSSSSYSSKTEISSSRSNIPNSGFNELGDSYSIDSSANNDNFKVFTSLSFGGFPLSDGDATQLATSYNVSQSNLSDTNSLLQVGLNMSYFYPSQHSLYISISYVYRTFNYKATLATNPSTYYQGSFGTRVGANLVLASFNKVYVSVIPYLGVILANELVFDAGALLVVDNPEIGMVGLGVDAILTGDLAGNILVYFEIGF
jgi:hypothetical protein